MQLHIRYVKRGLKWIGRLLVIMRSIISPKHPKIWLVLSCPGVKRALKCKLYLKMAALSTGCLWKSIRVQDKSPFCCRNAGSFWFDHAMLRSLKSLQMSETMPIDCGHWHYYTTLQIARVFKLFAYFGLQRNSMFLPQRCRACAHLRY